MTAITGIVTEVPQNVLHFAVMNMKVYLVALFIVAAMCAAGSTALALSLRPDSPRQSNASDSSRGNVIVVPDRSGPQEVPLYFESPRWGRDSYDPFGMSDIQREVEIQRKIDQAIYESEKRMRAEMERREWAERQLNIYDDLYGR